VNLISSFTKGLKDWFGHVPDLQRSSHTCIVACTMHAVELRDLRAIRVCEMNSSQVR
jgi:hypothetical protein